MTITLVICDKRELILEIACQLMLTTDNLWGTMVEQRRNNSLTKSKRKIFSKQTKSKQEDNYNKPVVLGSSKTKQGLKYIEDYFNQNGKDIDIIANDNLADYMPNPLPLETFFNNNGALTITAEERDTIIRAISLNKGYLAPFIAEANIIDSLYKKGLAEKSNEPNLFQITKDVKALVEMEGGEAFEEVLE